MADKDRIATYYSNARELVKQNKPKEARAYVLAILNYALDTYKSASTILLKAKAGAFLDKWIAVSRELYDKGITDFVLKSFSLPTKQEQQLPKVDRKPARPQPKKDLQPKSVEPKPAGTDKEIDISGLIEGIAESQGWCAQVFEKNKSAVVEISAYDSNTDTISIGTGFIISRNGYLLTNDHVVYNEESQRYYSKASMSFAGNKKSYKLNILFSDKKSDVALCSFNPEEVGEFTVIKCVSDYSKVLPGAECIVIGNAFDMGISPFPGGVRCTKNRSGNLVHTAPSNPGDSGGPVLNRQGECIGINKSRTLTVNNVSADGYVNATPMDKIDELLKKWCGNNGIKL